LIQSYCEYFDITSYIFRFVSFVGPRYTHGVIFDFMKKLQTNPNELEILGDGKQRKSYLHVEDGVQAILYAIEHASDKCNIFNLGNKEYMNVVDLADILCKQLDLKTVKYTFTGGERGWLGDSPFVHLDISKIVSLGWQPSYSIHDSVIATVNYLKDNLMLLEKR